MCPSVRLTEASTAFVRPNHDCVGNQPAAVGVLRCIRSCTLGLEATTLQWRALTVRHRTWMHITAPSRRRCICLACRTLCNAERCIARCLHLRLQQCWLDRSAFELLRSAFKLLPHTWHSETCSLVAFSLSLLPWRDRLSVVNSLLMPACWLAMFLLLASGMRDLCSASMMWRRCKTRSMAVVCVS
jgi:hypothetical protein